LISKEFLCGHLSSFYSFVTFHGGERNDSVHDTYLARIQDAIGIIAIFIALLEVNNKKKNLNKQTRIKTRYQAKQQPVFQPPKYFLTVEERKRDQYDERNVDSSHFHHHGERKASDRYFFRVITYLYEYAIAILTFVFASLSFYISILLNDPASAFTTISNAFSTVREFLDTNPTSKTIKCITWELTVYPIIELLPSLFCLYVFVSVVLYGKDAMTVITQPFYFLIYDVIYGVFIPVGHRLIYGLEEDMYKDLPELEVDTNVRTTLVFQPRNYNETWIHIQARNSCKLRIAYQPDEQERRLLQQSH